MTAARRSKIVFKPVAPFAVEAAVKTAAFAVKPASQATPASVYLPKQKACASSEINNQKFSLSHAPIFTRPSEEPLVSAQMTNLKQRCRSTQRSFRMAPRRLDRASSHAPQLRRRYIQSARCGERPSDGGSKLARSEYPASGLKCAQPDRAQPVRRGGRPPRAQPKLTQRIPSDSSSVPPKSSPIRRGGRPSPRRPPGLGPDLRFRLGLAERDATVCERWLVRDEIGLTDINQLGLLSISDILELTKGLSKIGRRVLELAWSKLHAQFFCPECSRL